MVLGDKIKTAWNATDGIRVNAMEEKRYYSLRLEIRVVGCTNHTTPL